MQLYIDNTLTIRLTGLRDQAGNRIDGATVEVTVRHKSGSPVSGGTWPLVLTDDGNGDYSGQLDHTLALKAGERYVLEVIANKAGKQAAWQEEVAADPRPF